MWQDKIEYGMLTLLLNNLYRWLHVLKPERGCGLDSQYFKEGGWIRFKMHLNFRDNWCGTQCTWLPWKPHDSSLTYDAKIFLKGPVGKKKTTTNNQINPTLCRSLFHSLFTVSGDTIKALFCLNYFDKLWFKIILGMVIFSHFLIPKY